jgi:sugar phosphate permease
MQCLLVVLGLAGIIWLSRVTASSSYLFGVALPMVLIGVGQGGALSPLTAFGITRVAPEDAGAASGLVNVAHRLDGSLGLGILTVVFASAGSNAMNTHERLAEKVSAAFTGSAVLLALSLLIVFLFIVRSRDTQKSILNCEIKLTEKYYAKA